jgi:hypothetical protein
MIRLNIWEQVGFPERIMILYEGQVPMPESPSLNQKWRIYYTFNALNPLITPYPEGTQLFRARHSSVYPYELIDIIPIKDVFNIEDPGTYFVAYIHQYPGTMRLPFTEKYIFIQNGEKII